MTESLSNAVQNEWLTAMDRFFSSVDRERVKRGLTVAQAQEEILLGYGEEIADDYAYWSDEDEEEVF